MRRAMAEAEVGDDVYGEDPTVNRLQAVAAERLGFEAALWVPSGVMGNEIAVRLLTRPGDELLCEERSHVVQYELGGLAQLSGVTARTLAAPDGRLTPEAVRGALRPRVYYRSDTTALVLENTHNLAGGTFYDAAQHRAVVAACREAGLRVHVDGARIWNAAAALGVPARELLAGVDTAMVTLSKGLCAPAGSLLLASRDLVAEARRVRKLLGGGMRQIGVLAAAGLVAIETMEARLPEDHERARRLGAALAAGAGIELLRVHTNIVVARLPRGGAPELAGELAQRGVLVAAMDATTLRLVTHRDVDDAGCARAIAALEAALERRPGRC
jgi:threonine aldolase